MEEKKLKDIMQGTNEQCLAPWVVPLPIPLYIAYRPLKIRYIWKKLQKSRIILHKGLMAKKGCPCGQPLLRNNCDFLAKLE